MTFSNKLAQFLGHQSHITFTKREILRGPWWGQTGKVEGVFSPHALVGWRPTDFSPSLYIESQ